MQKINVHLQFLPLNTPPGSIFYLAGNCNEWQPDDAQFRFQSNGDGSYGLVLQTDLDTLEYKITRGRWSAVEGDGEGRERPNRGFKIGPTENDLWLRVESWTDMRPEAGRGNIQLLHPDFLAPQLGRRRRRIWACLPPDYWDHPQQRYPVIYMQDGQNLFDNPDAIFGSWDIDKAMNRLFVNETPSTVHRSPSTVQPILIGIENGGEHRLAEYSPWRHPEHGGGEGASYLDFVCTTLKPFVDEHLRTLPAREHTGIMGSSMGGLMALYAAIEKPDVFGMAGVFSPSLWFSQAVFRLVKARKPVSPVKILLMAGQQESRDMVGDLLDMYETLLEAGHAKHDLHYDLHSDGTHSEHFWARELEHALRWLFGEMPEHTHGGISDELIQFRLDPQVKELIIDIASRIQQPHLEIRDYCHDRQFHHALRHADNRISYAEWEDCVYSIRLLSEGDLLFSRRVALGEELYS